MPRRVRLAGAGAGAEAKGPNHVGLVPDPSLLPGRGSDDGSLVGHARHAGFGHKRGGDML